MITTSKALGAFCQRIARKKVKVLAIDTEFCRQRTYWPRPCLIQLATPDESVAIDMLKNLDMTPLKRVLSNPKITKVIHAATQDLEVIKTFMQEPPAPLFDTQIAAMFTAAASMPSYQALVDAHLGQHLPKGFQRYDWTKRPLSPKALDYALNDVRFLLPLYKILKKRLEKLSRTDWMESEMRAVLHAPPPPKASFKTVKGWALRPLSKRAFTLLSHVADWRENAAQTKNKPRQHIATDATILKAIGLAAKKDLDLTAIEATLKHIKADAKRTQSWMDILDWPQDRLLCPPKKPRTKPEIAPLKAKLLQTAETLDMPFSFLLTTKQLEKLAAGIKPEKIVQGWRHEALADLFYDGKNTKRKTPPQKRGFLQTCRRFLKALTGRGS